MFYKSVCVVILIALTAFVQSYTPGTNEYLLGALSPLVNPLAGWLFDGPGCISNAQTTRNKNKLPCVEQLQYYNYYSAAMYYGYGHHDLSCDYCLKFSCDVDEHDILNNNVHNTLALVTLSKKREEVVVAFRGTWNIWNVVTDALLIAGTNSNSPRQIKIHQGFYMAIMSLYDDVVRSVAKFLNCNRGFKVVITGHSLGGAMARLMYFFLEVNKQFPKVTYELYTYGEPRVGNEYFADFMNSQPITTARVIARADLVPHVPPTSVLGTKLLGDYYVHPQTEFWINGKENQKYCSRTVYEDPECSMSLGPLYSPVDHLVYFDTNIAGALGQPLVFAYLPFKILNPVDVLPPLPKPIENLIGGLSGGAVSLIAPFLG